MRQGIATFTAAIQTLRSGSLPKSTVAAYALIVGLLLLLLIGSLVWRNQQIVALPLLAGKRDESYQDM